MTRSLYGTLATTLLALLLLLGAAAIPLIVWTNGRYVQEAAQRLNRDLAVNILTWEPPQFRNGEIDREELSQTFYWAMVVNPSIEMYLLDPQGKILAFSAPPERVVRTTVDLAPVRRLLAGAALPVLGDDPRGSGRRKVFSAAVLGEPEHPEGYLYVVLGGELHDSAVQMVSGSLILRLGLGALAGSVVLALVAGLLVLAAVTRRLRRLDAAVASFEASGFNAEVELPTARSGADDEIDRLGARFQAMAGRMMQQLAEIKRADLLRRELIANISHDLRNPLATLRGYLDTLLLKDPTLSGEQKREYLEVAARQSERLGKLVGDLFELAKLDAAAVAIHRETFSLGELVQDVVQKFQLAAEERGVRVRAELPERPPLVVADISLIERVLENLVDNALRHTPAGGEVVVAPVARGERVTVRISDTGDGIPEEELPYLFERFYQRRSRNRDTAGGSGLGLAIAKRILDLHDGSIAAESRVGAGTTFIFELAAVR